MRRGKIFSSFSLLMARVSLFRGVLLGVWKVDSSQTTTTCHELKDVMERNWMETAFLVLSWNEKKFFVTCLDRLVLATAVQLAGSV